uniref:NAD(P)H-hydrate dehydratase n=1 Tax=Sandarakinorhabdus sp. TaxID=1916663 RepID=UPI00286EABC8
AASGPVRSEPAATMAKRWTGPTTPLADAVPAPFVIDALFGTGLARALPDDVQRAVDRLRGHARRTVAIDIASGVNADTGAAFGRPLAADMTVSFAALRPGHILGAGRALSGRVHVVDIGVAPDMTLALTAPPRLKGLSRDTHKHARGAVLVVEGEARHGGAAQLTALAALRTGAGLVTLAGEGTALPALAIMRRDDDDALAMLSDRRLKAAAIGPGLGNGERGRLWLARLLYGKLPVVVDAGALVLSDFTGATAPLVLTPHPGEFSRLFGSLGDDRVAAVRAAAVRSGAVVLLKGAETIIARPDGRAAINIHATPYLATAGSGDVLTGIIAALIAQGVSLFDAACAGAWLHGDAGRRFGPGLIADDLPGLMPAVLAGLAS